MEELINTVAQVIGEKDRKEYAPDFSLILSGEDNREEMLALFIEESRKDLAALTAALDRQDKEAAASILHKNLPLWETVRSGFPDCLIYMELVTEPATEWTNRQSMEMRDIIRAVEKLIVYAEKYGGKPMKTILIIEDDIVFSRSISNWLVKKGMKTECVATLANARKAIGQKEFDLILADLRLPDGNSTSLLKWMNEKYYSIPFLIMTNYGQVENAVTTMQLEPSTTCVSLCSQTISWL